MMLDDHELINNWEPGIVIDAADAAARQLAPAMPDQIAVATDKRLEEGKAAYRRFQRMAGPPLRADSALWCTFTQSGMPFFLADTRTERGKPDRVPRRVDNWRQTRIMDDTQWLALCQFLFDHKQQVSFVVSPSMLLPRRLGLACDPSLALEDDAWVGFPASMHDLLAFLCKHELNRVVFLSGDAHTSCVVQATVTDGTRSATFWSVHSSGLYSPYPFANDIRENYADQEMFYFRLSDDDAGAPTRTYRCKVERAEFFPGDGFAILTLTHTGANRHELRVRFNRAGCDSGHAGCNSARAGCNLEGPLIHL
jgi:phosphodiesterase/alkaline phosphatase D-like protein